MHPATGGLNSPTPQLDGHACVRVKTLQDDFQRKKRMKGTTMRTHKC